VIESLHAATQGLWIMACPEIEHILSIFSLCSNPCKRIFDTNGDVEIPGENLWSSLTEQCFRKQVVEHVFFLELRISEFQEKGVKEDKEKDEETH